jgi:hypothetical protein
VDNWITFHVQDSRSCQIKLDAKSLMDPKVECRPHIHVRQKLGDGGGESAKLINPSERKPAANRPRWRRLFHFMVKHVSATWRFKRERKRSVLFWQGHEIADSNFPVLKHQLGQPPEVQFQLFSRNSESGTTLLLALSPRKDQYRNRANRCLSAAAPKVCTLNALRDRTR